MTIYTTISIGGSNVSDFSNYEITKSTGANNKTSIFYGNLDNPYGKNANKYNIGDEILVYAEKDVNPPTNLIFRGLLEEKRYTGRPNDESIACNGKDYMARLIERTIAPETYSGLYAGSIVKDIVTKYTQDLTITNVQDSTQLVPNIVFNHTPVFDAVKKLAEYADFNFYVDNAKDLHFEPKAGSFSGQTFDSTNVLQADFRTKRDTVYNRIWVYGDRYLDGFRESILAGSFTLMGSSYTLLYSPTNTEVTVNGTRVQPGGIFEITSTPGSNIKYLVDYNNRRIIFTSGTMQGNNVPIYDSSIVIEYKRPLPIVKVADNYSSQSQFGIREKQITDKNIKDPLAAEQLVQKEIENSAFPQLEGNVKVKGVLDLTPGQTCLVNLPYHQINNEEYEIIEAKYDFTKSNCLSDSVLSVKLNSKIPDLADTIKDILLQLKKLQAGDISNSDTLTRYQYSTGSIGMRTSGIILSARNMGSSFLLSDPSLGLIGSYSTHSLGYWGNGSVILWSGGY